MSTEMNSDEKLKYAIEELNKWMRHMENYLWGVSSILLTGTIGTFIAAIKYYVRYPFGIVGIGIIISIIWFWYLNYLNNTTQKILAIYYRINKYEKSFGIDILPDIESSKMKEINAFPNMMINVTYLIWGAWGILIIAIINHNLQIIKSIIGKLLC